MAHQGSRRRAKYRIALKLDLEWDADIITWLESIPPGSRSALVREALRAGLKQPARWDPVDIEELRHVVAEELARALAAKQVAPHPIESADPGPEDIEAEYGAKLDRMLGGLGGKQSPG